MRIRVPEGWEYITVVAEKHGRKHQQQTESKLKMVQIFKLSKPVPVIHFLQQAQYLLNCTNRGTS